MAEEAKSKERRSGLPTLFWMAILGLALLFFIVIGITSDKSIHGVLQKQSRSSEAIQGASPTPSH